MATLSRKEARTAAAQRGQRRAMEGRTCPDCGRGNATTKIRQPGLTGRKCRYCGWERLVIYGEVFEKKSAA